MNKKINIDEDRFQDIKLIKSSDLPVKTLTKEQKVLLNRKGNEFFNKGEIESALRIFTTTGYSDGLSRVADVYAQNNKEIEALKLYWLAHNKRKAEILIQRLSVIIQTIIN